MICSKTRPAIATYLYALILENPIPLSKYSKSKSKAELTINY